LRFNKSNEESIAFLQRAAEQIIGREGETATFLSRCLFSFACANEVALTSISSFGGYRL